MHIPRKEVSRYNKSEGFYLGKRQVIKDVPGYLERELKKIGAVPSPTNTPETDSLLQQATDRQKLLG